MRTIYNTRKSWTIGAAGMCAAVLFYAAVIGPALQRIQTLQRVLPEKRQELTELRAAADKYLYYAQAGTASTEQVFSSNAPLEILAAIETLSEQSDLSSNMAIAKRDQIRNIDGQNRSVIEVQLRRVAIKQVLEFVKLLSASDLPVRIQKLRLLTSAGEPNGLNALIELQAIAVP